MHKTSRLARAHRGFTLVEVLIAMLVVAILTAVAVPSYARFVVRGSRAAAQAELAQHASLQEKIYLNSNAYSNSVTAAYTGTSAGGLGIATGRTNDGKYTIAVAVDAARQFYTLRATPVATTPQAGDGNLTIDSTGRRLWGTKSW